MHNLSKVALLTTILLAISACGQKGPIEIIPSDRTEAEIITDIEERADSKTTQTQEPELTR